MAVIGGSGFLGSHLLRQLVAVGADVRALGLPPAPHIKGVRFEAGDARDAETVRRVVAGCGIVFNAAGPVAASV